jgi:hypothetical protein
MAVSCSATLVVSIIWPLRPSSELARSTPRIEASINERSPRGLGVTNVNLNAGAAGAVVAAGPQATSSIAAIASSVRAELILFFMMSSSNLNR